MPTLPKFLPWYRLPNNSNLQQLTDAINDQSKYFGLVKPVNNIVGTLGDSRTWQCLYVDAGNINLMSRGTIDWARFLTNQRIYHNPFRDMVATPGFTSAQILASYPTLRKQSPCGAVLVLGSSADRPLGFTALGAASGQPVGGTDSIINMRALRDQILADGKILFLLAEQPRGTPNALTAPQQQQQEKMVREFLSWQGIPGVYVVNSYNPILQYDSAVSAPIANSTLDGLHVVGYGAYKSYFDLIAVLNQVYPPLNLNAGGSNGAYNAALNPFGVLNTNPMFTGVGGTIGGTGVSGVLADNWTSAGGVSGATFTLSKQTDADGAVWQRVVGGGAAAASGSMVLQNPSFGALVNAGDVIEGFCECRVQAGQVGINGINLAMFVGGGLNINVRDMAPTDANDIYTTDAVRGTFRTPPFTVPINAPSCVPNIAFAVLNGTSPNFTVDVRACAFRKVQQ